MPTQKLKPTVQPTNVKRPRQGLVLFITFLLLLFIALNAWIYFYGATLFGPKLGTNVARTANVNTQETQSLTPTATPTPRPLLHGKITFRGGGGAGPQLASGYIDPFDPAQHTVQLFHISASDTVPVTSFTGKLKTDHGIQNLAFSRVNGTATNGEWEAHWTVSDTYLYTYELDLIATSANGATKPELILR